MGSEAFAVIGTREPDALRLGLLRDYLLERHRASPGAVLCTGGATGVDQEAARGWASLGGLVFLALPWPGYEELAVRELWQQFPGQIALGIESKKSHWDLAAKIHPAWETLGRGARALHARNVRIIDPVSEVFALPGTKSWGGGTGMGIRVAYELGKRVRLPIRKDLAPPAEVMW